MEKMTIKENENNTLKYTQVIKNINNDLPITEDTKSEEKIEYFTE